MEKNEIPLVSSLLSVLFFSWIIAASLHLLSFLSKKKTGFYLFVLIRDCLFSFLSLSLSLHQHLLQVSNLEDQIRL